MTDLHAHTLTDLLALYRSGDADPVGVMASCLDAIEGTDQALHAWVHLADASAMAAAELAARRWTDGTARPLEGVPFGVKDVIDTAGVVTTAGSRLYARRVPEVSATAVARLIGAGAILVGKTATPEFAFGDEISETPVANPWAPRHWVGGSSSGSAAAVAARHVPLCLGTDTGGSIRVPSSYCGVTGFKATIGRIPRDGLHPVSGTFDHIGPIARTVDDVVATLGVVAGHSGADPRSVRRRSDEVVPAAGDLRGLRVGVAGGWFTEGCEPAVLAARDRAVEVLEGLGASLRPVELANAEAAGTAALTITLAEFAASNEAAADRFDELSPSAARRLDAGSRLPALDYLRARARRAEVRRELDAVFSDVDLVLTPGTPTPAPGLAAGGGFFDGGDSMWLERVARCFLVANVTGVPALVLPAGSDGGLPVSVQLLGRPFDEATVLRAGREFQRVTDHHLAAPAL